MTVERLEQTANAKQAHRRAFLPLGRVLLLGGSVKNLLIVSRASIVEGAFFDYGAFLYPEGTIDSNSAHFDQDDIHTSRIRGLRPMTTMTSHRKS